MDQLNLHWTAPAQPSVALIGSVEGEPDLHAKVQDVLEHCRLELDKPVPGQVSAKVNPHTVFRCMNDKHMFKQKKPFMEQAGRMDCVLKTSWIEKRISQASAVVMLMPFGADWNNQEWAENEAKTTNRYTSIWNSSSSYGYALLLVAVQIGQTGGPAHPDVAALDERLDKLKSNLNIDPQLFIHLKAEDLQIRQPSSRNSVNSPGSSAIGVGILVQKLYRLVRDSSLAYYGNQIKRALQTMEYRVSQVGASNQVSSRGSSQRTQDVTEVGLIRAKYSLKAAIYSEYYGNPDQALGYYRKGFQSLASIIENTNMTMLTQVQYWTEYSHYKICDKLFSDQCAKDASHQLEAFMAGMKGHYTTNKEYLHWGWLSKQYVVFLEMMDTAAATSIANGIEGGLDETFAQLCRSQFYISAAKLEGRRKQAFSKISQSPRDSLFSTNTNAGTNRNSLVSQAVDTSLIVPLYVSLSAEEKRGKRTSIFRHRAASGAGSHDVPTVEEIARSVSAAALASTEEMALLLKETSEDPETKEQNLDHFSQVMSLLDKALLTTSSKHKRRRAYIQAQMADEYMTQGKFEQAAECLIPAVQYLCGEKWIPLAIPLLRKQMACAIYLGLPEDYLNAAMKLYGLAGPKLLNRYEREDLHKDVLSVMTSYSRPTKTSFNVRNNSSTESDVSNSTAGVHESIFIRPEFGMAAPIGYDIQDHLPHAYTFNTWCMAGSQTQVFEIDICFNNSKPMEIAGEKLPVLLKIKSLFHGRMKFSELVVHWSDKLVTQRIIAPGSANNNPIAPGEAPPTEAPLEFEYNRVVTIPLMLDLPESRVQNVLGRSGQECFVCVESIDFVLRSTFEKAIESNMAVQTSSSDEVDASSAFSSEIEELGANQSRIITHKDHIEEVVDFILKCHTVPEKISRSRRQDESMGIVPKSYEDYAVTLKRSPINGKNKDGKADEPSPVMLLSTPSFRVLHIVKPVGSVRLNQRLMKRANNNRAGVTLVDAPKDDEVDMKHMSSQSIKSIKLQGNSGKKATEDAAAVEAKEKALEIKNEAEAHFTILSGCVQRINLVFDTCSNDVSAGKLYLSSNSTSISTEDASGLDAVFWYPHIHEVVQKKNDQPNVDVHDLVSFYPLRTNDSLQPAEPILLPEQESNSSFVVPLFLYSSQEKSIDIRLQMEYIPNKTFSVYSSLIKEFTVHVNFSNPLECLYDYESHSEANTAAALGLERVDEGVTESTQTENSVGTLLRGDTMSVTTTISCTNALKGEIFLKEIRLIPLIPDFGEEATFEILPEYGDEIAVVSENVVDVDGFGGGGFESTSNNIGCILTQDERVVLKEGEAYAGAVDVLCCPRTGEDSAMNLLAILGSGVDNCSSRLPLKPNKKVCSVGDISVEWYRPDDSFLLIPAIISTARISPPASQHSILSVSSTSSMASTDNGAAVRTDVDHSDFSWILPLGALSEAATEDSFAPSTTADSGRDDSQALNLSVSRTRIGTKRFHTPTVRILDSPFSVECDIPAKAEIGNPINCQIQVTNKLKTTEKLTLVVPQGNSNGNSNGNSANAASQGAITVPLLDNFLIAGPVQQNLVLLPNNTQVVELTLVPLVYGHISVPKIVLMWPRCGQNVLEVQRKLFVNSEVNSSR